MNSVRRTWSLPDIVKLLPDLQESRTFIVRCKGKVTGEGRYIKEADGVRQVAGIVVQATSDDTLRVSLGHEWPADITADRVDELDQAVLRGIAESLVTRCSLAFWGCGITTISATYAEGTKPWAVRIAASMAMLDLLNKADWSSPEPPPPRTAA